MFYQIAAGQPLMPYAAKDATMVASYLYLNQVAGKIIMNLNDGFI